jgi:hypothetical protein
MVLNCLRLGREALVPAYFWLMKIWIDGDENPRVGASIPPCPAKNARWDEGA